ncbi:RNA polymerase sigma factor [Streptomyces sp. NPDC015492]|uniref:RNA polymerase sigma factor n=1 Tax=Streptomyces sp. NPDC015492 TaxID=3364958 RepID=UPI0036FE77CD
MDPDFRARIRAGDESAFGVLFREHGTAVYNHCFRLTGERGSAEDCMSLVFLEAWRLREKAEPHGGSLRPWLLGLSTFVVHRRRRVARRHQALMERLPAPEPLPDFADELAGRLDDQERLVAIRQVFRRLSRADQNVLALCVWAGLDYAAAAQALDVPVGTVRSRLSRARRRLEKLTEKNLGFGVELSSTNWRTTGDRTIAVRPKGDTGN